MAKLELKLAERVREKLGSWHASDTLHCDLSGDWLLLSAGRTPSQNVCRMCETGQHIQRVALPFVFRYLAVELAAMNIKCTMTVK